MDIYFDKNYGKLYESIEGGESIVLDFESNQNSTKIEIKSFY